jgi:hypothetical protein
MTEFFMATLMYIPILLNLRIGNDIVMILI